MTSPPVPTSRTWIVLRSAGPLNVSPPATVVGANDAAPACSQRTRPVAASNAWTDGSCMGRSRGSPGWQYVAPLPSNRPKSPRAVDPITCWPSNAAVAMNPPEKPPNTTLVCQRSRPVLGSRA